MFSHKSKLARLVALFAAFALVLAACSGDDDDSADGGSGDGTEQPGDGVEVTPARANWNTGFFQAAIYSELLGELGYEVGDEADNELGPDIFYPALAQGEYDFWANGWFPIHDPQLETELPDGSTVADNVSQVGTEVSQGALQGYLIDKATAEEHDITTVSQIVEDPELSELFDTDGDGVADLAGCNDGWGCAGTINETIELNGWEDELTHVQGEYSLLFTDVVSRYEQGDPVFYYTWTPNFTVAQLVPGEDVVWLGIGDAELPEGQEGAAELPEGECAADPCEMGFVPADIRVVANGDFLSENAAAEALFEAVEIPADDIYAQNLEMNDGADTQDDIESQAQQWIEDNRDMVDEWLEQARSAA